MQKLRFSLLCSLVALGTPLLSAQTLNQPKPEKPVITKQTTLTKPESVKQVARQWPQNTFRYYITVRLLLATVGVVVLRIVTPKLAAGAAKAIGEIIKINSPKALRGRLNHIIDVTILYFCFRFENWLSKRERFLVKEEKR